MKKKPLVIFCILLLLFGGVFVVIFTQGFNRQKINTAISERAKEYLKDRNHTQSLKDVNIATINPSANAVYGEKDKMNSCFNFTIPFATDNHHSEQDCSEYFSLANPKGTLYASETPTSVSSLDDLSDMIMRRRLPDQYEESRLRAGDREFVVFRTKQEAYQKTAFFFTGQKVFILTLTSDSTPDVEQKFKAILASLQLL